MHNTPRLLVIGLLATTLAGCGSDEPPTDREQIEAMVADLHQAFAERDVETLCHELLPADYLTIDRLPRNLREHLRELQGPILSGSQRCERDFRSHPPDNWGTSEPPPTIGHIDIAGTGGIADVYYVDGSGGPRDVAKIGGRWRWVIDD